MQAPTGRQLCQDPSLCARPWGAGGGGIVVWFGLVSVFTESTPNTVSKATQSSGKREGLESDVCA